MTKTCAHVSGDENWADYFTKHHPPSHHAKVRPVYLKEKGSPCNLQGCVELIKGHQPAGTRAGVKRQAQGLQGMAKRQASEEQAKLPLVAMRLQARLAKCQLKPAYQAYTLASRKC